MKTYRVTALVTMSLSTLVEAESQAEAREIAESRGVCGVMDCERLGYRDTEVWCHSGEIDGLPEVQSVLEDES